MNLCVVSTYNGTKEDYLKLYESFKVIIDIEEKILLDLRWDFKGI